MPSKFPFCIISWWWESAYMATVFLICASVFNVWRNLGNLSIYRQVNSPFNSGLDGKHCLYGDCGWWVQQDWFGRTGTYLSCPLPSRLKAFNCVAGEPKIFSLVYITLFLEQSESMELARCKHANCNCLNIHFL